MKNIGKILLIALFLISSGRTYAQSNIDTEIKQLWGEYRWTIVIDYCGLAKLSSTHCKIVMSFVWKAESNFGINAYRHNIFGNSKYKFNSDKEAIKKFLETYNKYYYKVSYKWFCPNWSKSAWQIYNKLKKYL